jgi:hypothetical protein
MAEWVSRLRHAALSTLGDDSPAAVRATAARAGRHRAAGLLAASILQESTVVRPLSFDETMAVWSLGRIAPPPPEPGRAHGPLTARSPDDAIEIWTETEIAAVHWAWSVPGWRGACESAALWLVEEIQPDNATNLPWAVHVFAAVSARSDNQRAGLYAQTLLHNALVMRTRPDPLAALILLDSAYKLERAAADGS